MARRGSSGHHERVLQSLGSGARALRKYACDAMPKRGTMHAKHNEMGRDGICLNVRRARVKK
eukprot:1321047-Pleurochrysis_carterae.AAC.1